MKFNQEVNYAIKMVLLCSESIVLIPGVEIVNQCKIPERWGKVILTKLCHHKILRSIKGKNGGFILNRHPQEINLFDIVSIFDPIEISYCISDKSFCLYRSGECSVYDKLTSLKYLIENELKKLTIKDLMVEQKKIIFSECT